MMNLVHVTCGLIIRNEKVLICRRKEGKSLAGYWEFPGGKIEPGETVEECLMRELKEELGLEVEIKRHFLTVTHAYSETTIKLSSFICGCSDAEIVLTDHDAYKWVEVSELMNWRLAPADVAIAEALQNLTSN
jgi:8-oxo-dGTP diphosphatase